MANINISHQTAFRKLCSDTRLFHQNIITTAQPGLETFDSYIPDEFTVNLKNAFDEYKDKGIKRYTSDEKLNLFTTKLVEYKTVSFKYNKNNFQIKRSTHDDGICITNTTTKLSTFIKDPDQHYGTSNFYSKIKKKYFGTFKSYSEIEIYSKLFNTTSKKDHKQLTYDNVLARLLEMSRHQRKFLNIPYNDDTLAGYDFQEYRNHYVKYTQSSNPLPNKFKEFKIRRNEETKQLINYIQSDVFLKMIIRLMKDKNQTKQQVFETLIIAILNMNLEQLNIFFPLNEKNSQKIIRSLAIIFGVRGKNWFTRKIMAFFHDKSKSNIFLCKDAHYILNQLAIVEYNLQDPNNNSQKAMDRYNKHLNCLNIDCNNPENVNPTHVNKYKQTQQELKAFYFRILYDKLLMTLIEIQRNSNQKISEENLVNHSLDTQKEQKTSINRELNLNGDSNNDENIFTENIDFTTHDKSLLKLTSCFTKSIYLDGSQYGNTSKQFNKTDNQYNYNLLAYFEHIFTFFNNQEIELPLRMKITKRINKVINELTNFQDDWNDLSRDAAIHDIRHPYVQAHLNKAIYELSMTEYNTVNQNLEQHLLSFLNQYRNSLQKKGILIINENQNTALQWIRSLFPFKYDKDVKNTLKCVPFKPALGKIPVIGTGLCEVASTMGLNAAYDFTEFNTRVLQSASKLGGKFGIGSAGSPA